MTTDKPADVDAAAEGLMRIATHRRAYEQGAYIHGPISGPNWLHQAFSEGSNAHGIARRAYTVVSDGNPRSMLYAAAASLLLSNERIIAADKRVLGEPPVREPARMEALLSADRLDTIPPRAGALCRAAIKWREWARKLERTAPEDEDYELIAAVDEFLGKTSSDAGGEG